MRKSDDSKAKSKCSGNLHHLNSFIFFSFCSQWTAVRAWVLRPNLGFANIFCKIKSINHIFESSHNFFQISTDSWRPNIWSLSSVVLISKLKCPEELINALKIQIVDTAMTRDSIDNICIFSPNILYKSMAQSISSQHLHRKEILLLRLRSIS